MNSECKEIDMLLGLLGLVLFCIAYYFLWAGWRRYAPDVLPVSVPNWIRRPNFFLFLFVTLIFIFLYRKGSR